MSGGGESTAAVEVEAYSVAGMVVMAETVMETMLVAMTAENPQEGKGGGGGGDGDLAQLDPEALAGVTYYEDGWKGKAGKAVVAAVVRVVGKGDGKKGAGEAAAAAAVVRCVRHSCGGGKGGK